MSIRKKFFLIFLFILLDMFLVIGYLVIRNATMLNDLRKEVDSLTKLDITKDRYNQPIQTRGNYAIVERAIKDYLDQYAVSLQEVLLVIKDPTLTQVLSYNNYVADGPDFLTSINYLSKTKEEFNAKMDDLLNKLEEDSIRNYIDDKTYDSYYRNLYVDLMLSDSMKDDFIETKDLLQRTKTRVNKVIDTSSEILSFLVLHKEEWKLEEGEIRFLTEDLYNQYTLAISKLNVQ